MKSSLSIEKSEILTHLTAMKNDGLLKVQSCNGHIETLDRYKNDLANNDYKYKEKSIIKILKALDHLNRLEIVLLLKNGLTCSCELEYVLELSQPTMSHHLKILEDAGIIAINKVGKWNIIQLIETPIIFWLLEKLK